MSSTVLNKALFTFFDENIFEIFWVVIGPHKTVDKNKEMGKIFSRTKMVYVMVPTIYDTNLAE